MPSAVASSSRSPSPNSASVRSKRSSRASSERASSSSAAATASSPVDPYYGHRETAKSAANFITALFACPNIPPPTGGPQPTLAHFIAYALHRTRLPEPVTVASLLLLSRLKARFPAARGSSGHRLFISAFMMASKILCDDTYSNKSWAIVAQGMFALKEINQMEREMLGYLDWNVHVSRPEIDALRQTIAHSYSPSAFAIAAASAGPSISRPSSPSYVSPSQTSAPEPSHVHAHGLTTAYPSPPCSPIHISAYHPYSSSTAFSSVGPSNSSSPASSLGSTCTTPPNGTSRVVAVPSRSASSYKPVETAVTVRAVGDDDESEWANAPVVA